MDEQSRESSDTTPIEYSVPSGPTTRSHTNLEQTKESEKGEFEDSNIVCKMTTVPRRVLLQGYLYFLAYSMLFLESHCLYFLYWVERLVLIITSTQN